MRRDLLSLCVLMGCIHTQPSVDSHLPSQLQPSEIKGNPTQRRVLYQFKHSQVGPSLEAQYIRQITIDSDGDSHIDVRMQRRDFANSNAQDFFIQGKIDSDNEHYDELSQLCGLEGSFFFIYSEKSNLKSKSSVRQVDCFENQKDVSPQASFIYDDRYYHASKTGGSSQSVKSWTIKRVKKEDATILQADIVGRDFYDVTITLAQGMPLHKEYHHLGKEIVDYVPMAFIDEYKKEFEGNFDAVVSVDTNPFHERPIDYPNEIRGMAEPQFVKGDIFTHTVDYFTPTTTTKLIDSYFCVRGRSFTLTRFFIDSDFDKLPDTHVTRADYDDGSYVDVTEKNSGATIFRQIDKVGEHERMVLKIDSDGDSYIDQENLSIYEFVQGKRTMTTIMKDTHDPDNPSYLQSPRLLGLPKD